MSHRTLAALALLLATACTHEASEEATPEAAASRASERAPESDEDRPGGWRLAASDSPYLRQHADNDVDWYAWGPEAFERARAEDKPVFLSIGYSACHWCHVMEHESFENPDIAAYLREHFISVKVDREQRPDVDSRYMQAVQQMTGSGGWPLTAFLTPEGAPFFGGTYFPPERQRGMPGFRELLEWVHKIWTEQRPNIEKTANSNLTQLTTDIFPPPRDWDAKELLGNVPTSLTAALDPIYGGIRSSRPQRFPPSMLLRFLFRQQLRIGTVDLTRAFLTLDMMASGGMRDHVGGGFHRYSTDPQWKVPHFEKMLYDNGVLAALYAEAYALSGRAFYADVARDTLEWLMTDMRSPRGLYYAARDADSLPFDEDGQPVPGAHPEEGDVYTWTLPELEQALGAEEAATFARLFDIRNGDRGNFERGRSIPMPLKALDRVAADPTALLGSRSTLPEGEAFNTWLDSVYDRLLAVRSKRPQAFRDEKCLSAWNGLALTGFSISASLLDDEALTVESDSLASAIRDTLLTEDEDHKLWVAHQWFEGRASGQGVLTDYAYVARGFLDAYHATGNPEWLVISLRLAYRMLDLFEDPEKGGLFETLGDDPLLPGRLRELNDGARASGHSVALHHMLRVAPLDDSGRLAAAVDRALDSLAPVATKNPHSFTSLLTAIDSWQGPLAEVVIDGAEDLPATEAMRAMARTTFLPAALVISDAARAREALAGSVLSAEPSLLAGRQAPEGEARAWVCQRGVCLLPATSPEVLAEQLTGMARRDAP